MSITAIMLMAALVSASPRGASKAAQQQAKVSTGPMGIVANLTLGVTSRPERSKGGADLVTEAGVRGAYLWTMDGKTGLTLGGELALRSWLPHSDGSSEVGSDIFLVSTQLGGIVGYRLATQNLSLLPHASMGISNGIALVHLRSPGNETWRPRVLPGPYFGGGVIATLFMVMLRLDASLGVVDGRPEYRFDTGVGVYF